MEEENLTFYFYFIFFLNKIDGAVSPGKTTGVWEKDIM